MGNKAVWVTRHSGNKVLFIIIFVISLMRTFVRGFLLIN